MDTYKFVQKFRELFMKAPLCGSYTRASENCDYCDIVVVSKDCYMCFNLGQGKDCYYSEDSKALRDCCDCSFSENCELCYQCVDCDSCYNCDFCQDCHNCQDLKFCFDLRRCRNCIACSGLRDREFCIFNQQYSEDQYREKLKMLDLNDQAGLAYIQGKLDELKLSTPRLYSHQHDTENCSGDYVYHSKNCYMCFDTRHSEDSAYIVRANLDSGTKDSYDCGPMPTGMDLCYDVSYAHYLFNCKHIYFCGMLKDCEWCTNCFQSSNLFGCHSLKDKEDGFWFLNEKVSEENFHYLKRKINRELKDLGIYTTWDLLWKVELGPVYEAEGNCGICQEEFEIRDEDIAFYQKLDLPKPAYCPACRANHRVKMRNPRKMYKRSCDLCKKNLVSTFKQDSPHTVCCIDCYWDSFN